MNTIILCRSTIFLYTFFWQLQFYNPLLPIFDGSTLCLYTKYNLFLKYVMHQSLRNLTACIAQSAQCCFYASTWNKWFRSKAKELWKRPWKYFWPFSRFRIQIENSKILTFKDIFLCQKLTESFSTFFFIEECKNGDQLLFLSYFDNFDFYAVVQWPA